MKSIVRVLCSAAMLTAAAAGATPAEKLPKIVVLGIKPIDESVRQTTDSLSEILTTDLAKTHRYEVMGESEIGSLVGFEKRKELLGCNDTNCLAEIGGALGADYLFMGTMGRVGKQMTLDFKIADARRNKIAAREGTQVEDIDGLIAAGRKALMGLLAQMPGGAGALTAPVETHASTSQGPGPAPWILVGVGAGAVVAGGVLVGVSVGNKSAYTYKQADLQASAGFITGGVGLAAVAAGIIWAAVGSTKAPGVAIAPTVGGATLCAGGTF
jgi:TolB-like protein